jgi:hypothetical protein
MQAQKRHISVVLAAPAFGLDYPLVFAIGQDYEKEIYFGAVELNGLKKW